MSSSNAESMTPTLNGVLVRRYNEAGVFAVQDLIATTLRYLFAEGDMEVFMDQAQLVSELQRAYDSRNWILALKILEQLGEISQGQYHQYRDMLVRGTGRDWDNMQHNVSSNTFGRQLMLREIHARSFAVQDYVRMHTEQAFADIESYQFCNSLFERLELAVQSRDWRSAIRILFDLGRISEEDVQRLRSYIDEYEEL